LLCGYVHCVEVPLATDFGPPVKLFLVLLIGYVTGMYQCYMFISMIIHDYVMGQFKIEKEFIPVGAHFLLRTELHSISMLCKFLDWL